MGQLALPGFTSATPYAFNTATLVFKNIVQGKFQQFAFTEPYGEG